MAGSVLAYENPGKPTGFVNDFAGLLTAGEKSALEIKIGNFERPAGVELAVVTVPSLGGDTVENFAVKLFADWGIGKAKKDNGILFLIAPTEREARIEVGYGLEPVVTDAASSYVMRNVIIPRFAEGKYAEGIDDGVDALIKLVEGDPEFAGMVDAAANDVEQDASAAPGIDWVKIAIFALIIILILASKGGRGGGFLTGLLLGGMRGGGRFGGGGFGGFGGGRSGGGGSSGRW